MHFTYNETISKNSLCQGDVLEITPQIRDTLEKIHPYFNRPQYKYFMVLTQSCDLVRRDGRHCKSPYITLAAVRSFDDFFKRELENGHYITESKGILFIDNKQLSRAEQFIERVINNTEPDFFFLFKDETVKLYESMVCYLKVSIALKSSEHYEECLEAKKVELSDEFKAKLGWLVGNLYSRVGTKDWSDVFNNNERQQFINNIIQERCIVGQKEQLKLIKDKIKDESIANFDDAKAAIEGIEVPSTYDRVIDVFEEILNTTGSRIKQEIKDNVMRDVKSRSVLKTLIPK